MHLPSASLLCGLMLTTPLSAQPIAFEVVSIKPTPRSILETHWGPEPGGRFTAEAATAKQLIALAYGVRESQVGGGPKWLDQNRWTIEAKAADFPGTFTRQQLLEAMKSVLADRFQLSARMETKEMPVYVLVVADGGLKLRSATESSPFVHVARGAIEGKSVSMDLLARTLSNALDRPVINQTALSGAYEVRLRWTPDPDLDAQTSVEKTTDHNEGSVPGSIFTEIQNQLGLRLKADRGPGQVVQIDRLEFPTEN